MNMINKKQNQLIIILRYIFKKIYEIMVDCLLIFPYGNFRNFHMEILEWIYIPRYSSLLDLED